MSSFKQNFLSRSRSFNGSSKKDSNPGLVDDPYLRAIFGTAETPEKKKTPKPPKIFIPRTTDLEGEGDNADEDPYLRAIMGIPTRTPEKKSLTLDDVFQSTSLAIGIDFEKHRNIPVECTGDFKPIETFDDTAGGIPKEVLSNVLLAKYKTPTPIQKYAIPVGLAKRDLMGCAQTGSGKTAAFLIPVISHILKEPENKKNSEPNTKLFYNRAKVYPTYLILAPTRELAIQIHKEALKFAFGTRIKPVVVYGGASIGGQIKQVERGADILVATPGRLMDILDRQKLSLERVKYLCFDEADRMLDMGFEPDVRRIVLDSGMPSVSNRVTTMFSATFPIEIQRLASEFLKEDYIHLTVGRIGSTNESITQFIKQVGDSQKRTEIVQDLKAIPGRTLVFCQRKSDTESLARFLFAQGFPASSIHGDREQREREAALAAFKSGRINVLVATDVASRGLDIPEVTHVINYDLPFSIDSYVHRIGRTGRAGNRGLASAYFDEHDYSLARDLVKLLREAKQVVPEFLLTVKGTGKSSKFGRRGGGKRHMKRDTPYGGGGGKRGSGGGGGGNRRGKARSQR